jgi:hypothetical protein
MPAQALEVGDEVRRRVVAELGRRRGPAGAALIEQDDAPEPGVEKAAVVRQAAAARTAVQEHDRNAPRIAAGLPVQLVPAVDGEPAVGVRLDFRKQRIAPAGCALGQRHGRAPG